MHSSSLSLPSQSKSNLVKTNRFNQVIIVHFLSLVQFIWTIRFTENTSLDKLLNRRLPAAALSNTIIRHAYFTLIMYSTAAFFGRVSLPPVFVEVSLKPKRGPCLPAQPVFGLPSTIEASQCKLVE